MITTVILLGIALVIAAVVLVRMIHRHESAYTYATLLGDLATFKYWISNCEISKANYTTATARIWFERNRSQSSMPEYRDLVYEITRIFTKRFADFMQEQRSKNNNT